MTLPATPARTLAGLFSLLRGAVEPSRWRAGLLPEMLWVCYLATSVTIVGLLLRRPDIVGFGGLFQLAAGLASWLLGAVRYLLPGPDSAAGFRGVIDALYSGEVESREAEAVLRALRRLLEVSFDPGRSLEERLRAVERETRALYVHTHLDEESFDTDRPALPGGHLRGGRPQHPELFLQRAVPRPRSALRRPPGADGAGGRAALGGFLTLLALPALAADPAAAVPAADAIVQTWRVADVAANDVLNVRVRPEAKAPVVGKLLPTATGVVELEQDGAGWMRVRLGEVSGWVNHRYLRPEYPADGSLPSELRCSGFEPMWAARISAGRWGMSSPQDDSLVMQPARIATQTGGVSWLVTDPAGLTKGGEWLLVQAAPQGAGDGGSNNVYPYVAVSYTVAEGALHGYLADNGVCHIPNERDRARP